MDVVVFVLGPAVLAWLLTRLSPRTGTMGRVMAGTTVLLLVSMLLGEAAICVLMAAPLVYGVAAVVVAANRWLGGRRAILVVLVLAPLADVGSADPVEVVEVTGVAADVDTVQARVAAGPHLVPEDRSWSLDLGYPVPDDPRTRMVDGTTEWAWTYGPGVTRFAMHERPGGWDFEVVEDTAMRRWFAWEDSRLDVRPHPDGAEVVLTLRFDPALGPDWWFATIERTFMDAAGDHLLDGLDLASAPPPTDDAVAGADPWTW